MKQTLARLLNGASLVAVVIASVTAYAALQPIVAASSAQSAGGAGQNSSNSNITSRVTVDKGTVDVSVTATGSVVANQQSSLAFQASGLVTQILVKQGDHVKVGQVLATVDDTNQQAALKQAQLNEQAAQSALDKLLQPVDPNTIAIAQASVKSAEGSYQSKSTATSPADIAALQSKVQQAQSDYNSAQSLMKDAGGKYATDDPNYQLAVAQYGQAGLTLRQAQMNLQTGSAGGSMLSAQANIAYAQTKLAQTEAGPSQTQIDTAQMNLVATQNQVTLAQHALDLTVLKAPYEGDITQINISVNQPAQGTAIVISDLSTLYANINVDESDVARIKTGQKLDLTVDALASVQLVGTVDRIYPITDSTASVITYPVHITFDKSNAGLRAGMTVNATFHVQTVENVVRVPNNYLKINPATGQTTVNRLAPDGVTVFPVPVKTGLVGADYTEIISGLSAGDTIALTAQKQGA
jgi:HlyD family secretion protein